MPVAELAEFSLSAKPDRMIMYVPGLNPRRARNCANMAAAEARRRMPKSTGYSANRLMPLYGKNYFGVLWQDCLAPGTRVLKADWTWVPVETLVVGDELIAFDEEIPEDDRGMRGRGRRYRTAEVTAAFRAQRDAVRITFDDGTTLVATKSHPWLARRGKVRRRRWIESGDLRPGDSLGVYFDVWETETDFEAGWLSGLYDGEGSYSLGANRKKDGSVGLSRYLTLAQNLGPVLDRALGILKEHSFEVVDRSPGRICKHMEITGGFAEQVRFLGSFRPTRLLGNIEHEGRAMEALRERIVVSVEDLGDQEVVVMSTSTQTYIAEGMGSHNCYVWFQEHGISPFTMYNLAGKTIPMWIKDPTGMERLRNPKAQVRVTMSGITEVLIFRKAAQKGARVTKMRKNRKTGQMEEVDVPASYPGAPGRIGVREAASPMTTPGRQGGAIAAGNGGVRWRHPGIAPRMFLNLSMSMAAQWNGILPIRVYVADQTWRNYIREYEEI